MANRFWIGNGGDWSDTSHWSTSSGGSSGASVPSSSDNVIFDANSFSTTGQTVILDASASILGLTFANVDQPMSFDLEENLITTGNVTLNEDMTILCDVSTGGNWRFQSPNSVTSTFDSKGVNFNLNANRVSLNFGGLSTGVRGPIALASDLTCRSCSIVGDFLTNNYAINTNTFTVVPGSYARTVNLGTSTITLLDGVSGTSHWSIDTTNLTAQFSSCTIVNQESHADRTFAGAGLTYGILRHEGVSSFRYYTITGSNIFNTIELVAGTGLKVTVGTTQTVTNFIANGTSSDSIRLRSTSDGSRFTLSKSSGIVASDYLDIKDSQAQGGAQWFAGANSTDSGNNLGWIFTAPVYNREISGTINFSGSAMPMIPAVRAISGTIGFLGSANIFIEVENEATERKTYMFKVYDEDDNFIGIWDDVITPFEYSHEINTAGASTFVKLARNSDSLTVVTENLLDSDGNTIDDSEDRPIQTTVQSRNQIGPGSTVNHNYRVDVYVFYGELSPILDSNGVPILDSDDNPILGQFGSPNGRRIFTGFISEIESKYGDDETTLVELTSFGFDLDQYVIETEGGDTTVPFLSVDPSDIVTDSMEQFNSIEGIINVSTQSVETTSTVVSYTYRVNTYLEVLQKAVELAPADWFWYADLGTNLIHFKERPTIPNHLFYLGEHIESLSLRSYIGDVINDVYFSGGEIDDDPVTNLFKRYTQTPASNTRRGLKRLNDNRVTLESSAEILSEGEIERGNRIQYRSTISILSEVYDIETINLGELIGFRNFDNYVDGITMQIVGIGYTPEKVVLALDTLPPRVSKRLEDIKRQLDLLENQNNPDAPT